MFLWGCLLEWVVVQSLSSVWLLVTPWTATHQASLSFTISRSLLKLMSIESVMPSNHFVLCHPLFLLSSIFPSIRVFYDESALCIRWPKYWHFSISPSNESVLLVTQSCPTLCDPMDCSMPGFPCPSPTPRVYPNSCPLSQWCHTTISSSVIPFSSCPQSLPALGSFQISQLFTSGGQRIGVSASTSVLPMNSQDWSALGWTGWISLQSKNSQESSPTPQFKSISSLALSFLYNPTLSSIHDYWKNHSFD